MTRQQRGPARTSGSRARKRPRASERFRHAGPGGDVARPMSSSSARRTISTTAEEVQPLGSHDWPPSASVDLAQLFFVIRQLLPDALHHRRRRLARGNFVAQLAFGIGDVPGELLAVLFQAFALRLPLRLGQLRAPGRTAPWSAWPGGRLRVARARLPLETPAPRWPVSGWLRRAAGPLRAPGRARTARPAARCLGSSWFSARSVRAMVTISCRMPISRSASSVRAAPGGTAGSGPARWKPGGRARPWPGAATALR